MGGSANVCGQLLSPVKEPLEREESMPPCLLGLCVAAPPHEAEKALKG